MGIASMYVGSGGVGVRGGGGDKHARSSGQNTINIMPVVWADCHMYSSIVVYYLISIPNVYTF